MNKEYLRDKTNDLFVDLFDGAVARTFYKIFLLAAALYFAVGILRGREEGKDDDRRTI